MGRNGRISAGGKKYEKNWKKIIREFIGKKIHLTMYGLPFERRMQKIKKCTDLMIIIGGEKVPTEVYYLTDYNFAVTSQPHSEVSALAVFLHELLTGKGKKHDKTKKNDKAKMKIIPQERGKKILRR